jgi:hypothetical protein
MIAREFTAKLVAIDAKLSATRKAFCLAAAACTAQRSAADALVLKALSLLDQARAGLCDISDDAIGSGEGRTATGRRPGRPRKGTT